MKDCLRKLKEKAEASSNFIVSQFEKEDVYTNPEIMNSLKKAMLLVKNMCLLISQIEKSFFTTAKYQIQLEMLELKLAKMKREYYDDEEEDGDSEANEKKSLAKHFKDFTQSVEELKGMAQDSKLNQSKTPSELNEQGFLSALNELKTPSELKEEGFLLESETPLNQTMEEEKKEDEYNLTEEEYLRVMIQLKEDTELLTRWREYNENVDAGIIDEAEEPFEAEELTDEEREKRMEEKVAYYKLKHKPEHNQHTMIETVQALKEQLKKMRERGEKV